MCFYCFGCFLALVLAPAVGDFWRQEAFFLARVGAKWWLLEARGGSFGMFGRQGEALLARLGAKLAPRWVNVAQKGFKGAKIASKSQI